MVLSECLMIDSWCAEIEYVVGLFVLRHRIPIIESNVDGTKFRKGKTPVSGGIATVQINWSILESRRPSSPRGTLDGSRYFYNNGKHRVVLTSISNIAFSIKTGAGSRYIFRGKFESSRSIRRVNKLGRVSCS